MGHERDEGMTDSSRLIREYYDAVHYSVDETARRVARKLAVSDPWYMLILDFLRRAEISVDQRRVLEVGCGLGGFSALIARRGGRVAATDFSVSAVRAAAELARDGAAAPSSDLQHLASDARRLPFREASFDLVVCAETLEHTFAAAECLREFARVCKPGGHAVVTVPNSLVSLPVDKVVSVLGVGQPQSPVNWFTLRHAAQAADFRIVDTYGVNFCRLMFSEDVLPAWVRRVTERMGTLVEPRMDRGNPLWVLTAGTVGFLLRKDPASAGSGGD